jgi:diguanylate cyclase (GGDEF)-like protein
MSQIIDHLAELTGSRDRDVVDVTLVSALRDLLRPHSVAIYRPVGDEGQRRWLTRASLGPGDLTPTADPLWADLHTLPALADAPERLACLQLEQMLLLPGPPACACFPLSTDHQTVGVLEIRTPELLHEEQVRIVSSILRVVRNFQGLLDYSERDTLTSLLNRKTFDESFLRIASLAPQPLPAGALAGSRRSKTPVSAWLAVIDIDHFKRVNDGFGHLIGDEVLLLLSRLMRSTFRFHDHLYRFGGEEFVVLMRCDTNADATAAFERLRLNVQGYDFPQVGRITVSIGKS